MYRLVLKTPAFYTCRSVIKINVINCLVAEKAQISDWRIWVTWMQFGLFLDRAISHVRILNFTFTHLTDACLSVMLVSYGGECAARNTPPVEKYRVYSFSLLCWEIMQPESPHLRDVAATRASLFLHLTSCTDATAQQTARAQPYQQAKEVPLLRTRADN